MIFFIFVCFHLLDDSHFHASYFRSFVLLSPHTQTHTSKWVASSQREKERERNANDSLFVIAAHTHTLGELGISLITNSLPRCHGDFLSIYLDWALFFTVLFLIRRSRHIFVRSVVIVRASTCHGKVGYRFLWVQLDWIERLKRAISFFLRYQPHVQRDWMSNWKQNTPTITKKQRQQQTVSAKNSRKIQIEQANEPLLDVVVHKNDESSQHEAFQSHLTKLNKILICLQARMTEM